MWILEIFLEHKILFLTVGVIVLLNIIYLVYLVKKDKKEDLEEIEELTSKKDDVDELKEKLIEVEKKEKVKKDSKADLEGMLEKMQEALETKKAEDVVANFESEQEEKSIISYQELVESLKSEKPIYEEAIEHFKSPDVIEIEHSLEKPEIVKIDLGDDVTKVEIPNVKKKAKFKNSEFVSPIFGTKKVNDGDIIIKEIKREKTQKKHRSNDSLEEVLGIEPLSEEIKKNDEFLKSLKEFRKNLE